MKSEATGCMKQLLSMCANISTSVSLSNRNVCVCVSDYRSFGKSRSEFSLGFVESIHPFNLSFYLINSTFTAFSLRWGYFGIILCNLVTTELPTKFVKVRKVDFLEFLQWIDHTIGVGRSRNTWQGISRLWATQCERIHNDSKQTATL
jgi:hypothetical protein